MMRSITATVVFLIAAGSVGLGQQSAPTAGDNKPQTQLEAFLSSKGTLLVKDFYDLGKVGGIGTMSIEALVISMPGQEARKIRGLRIEVSESGRLERSNTSFLDMDEIESLSKALAYMTDLASKWMNTEKQEYTEVQFATKGEFQIGFYQRKKEQGAFVSSGRVGGIKAFLKVADFEKIRSMADQSLTLLQGK